MFLNFLLNHRGTENAEKEIKKEKEAKKEAKRAKEKEMELR